VAVLFFELFPAFITIVAITIAVALFIIGHRRKGHPERERELRDPNRPDTTRGTRFTRPGMRG
jgi:hypothetical protein